MPLGVGRTLPGKAGMTLLILWLSLIMILILNAYKLVRQVSAGGAGEY